MLALERPDQYSGSSEGRYGGQEDVPSWLQELLEAHNISRREQIAEVAARLRPDELRELVTDLLDTALEAADYGDLEGLRSAAVGWLETAELMVTTRRRVRRILAARDEGRAVFGVHGEAAPER
jgi:hypothetical protein